MERTSVPCTRYLLDGGRLRIRMPRGTDRERLAGLVARVGTREDPLEAERLLRFDPRTRTVLIAGLWTGSTSQIVGYAAMTHGSGGRPDVLIVDEDLAPGATAELCAVLEAYADTRARFAA